MPTAALRRPPPTVRVGAVVWITSELLFFGTLFGAWFSLRSSNAGSWPPEGIEVERGLPIVGTVLLLASSATMHAATRRIAAGRSAAARGWILATLGLGAVFLLLLAREWSTLDFGVDDHAYATGFFALTGFHGLHVLGGLLAMVALVHRLHLGRDAHDAVEVVSYYWHFVDLVWLALFASVYLAA